MEKGTVRMNIMRMTTAMINTMMISPVMSKRKSKINDIYREVIQKF